MVVVVIDKSSTDRLAISSASSDNLGNFIFNHTCNATNSKLYILLVLTTTLNLKKNQKIKDNLIFEH